MPYHVLNPALAMHLLEGEVDELSDRQQAQIARIKQMPCPRCRAAMHPKLNTFRMAAMFNTADRVHTLQSPLFHMLATCECGVVLDPETGLVIDRGSAAKVKDDLPIIGEEP